MVRWSDNFEIFRVSWHWVMFDLIRRSDLHNTQYWKQRAVWDLECLIMSPVIDWPCVVIEQRSALSQRADWIVVCSQWYHADNYFSSSRLTLFECTATYCKPRSTSTKTLLLVPSFVLSPAQWRTKFDAHNYLMSSELRMTSRLYMRDSHHLIFETRTYHIEVTHEFTALHMG